MKINSLKSSTVLLFWLMNGLIFAQVDIIPAGNWFTNAKGFTIIVDNQTLEVADLDYPELLTWSDLNKLQENNTTNNWRLPDLDEFNAIKEQLYDKMLGDFPNQNIYSEKYNDERIYLGAGNYTGNRYDHMYWQYWSYNVDHETWSFTEGAGNYEFTPWRLLSNGDMVENTRRVRFIRPKTSTQSSEKALQDELTRIKAYQNLLAKEAEEKEAIRRKEAEKDRQWAELAHRHYFDCYGLGFNNYLSVNSPANYAITIFNTWVTPISKNLTFDFEPKLQVGLGTNEKWISKAYSAPIDSFTRKGRGGSSLSINFGFSVLPINKKYFSITITPFLGLDMINYPTVEISSIDKSYDDTDIPIINIGYGCSFNMRIGRNILLKSAYSNNFTNSIPIKITTSNVYSITTTTNQVPVAFSSFLFGIGYCTYLN